jgi:iron complex outermembrane recepter protein
MNRFSTISLRAVLGLSVAGFALIAGSAPAIAQSAPDAADEEGLETIVVTAQKRETNLQKTPIAISVLGSEDLKARSFQTLEDLMNGGSPSLRVVPFFSRSTALTIGIRGIVPFDANQPSRDAGVGVYIDGVYLGRSQGLGAALFDVERIEILKGPQGTLFGRNSTGGAVSIVTKAPSGEFSVRQTAGIGNFGSYKIETHVDLPAFGDVSIKLDGLISKRNGTVDNTLIGEQDFHKSDKRGLHVGVLWEPSDVFTARYDFDISQERTTPYYVQLITKSPTAPASAFAPLVQLQSNRADTVDIGVPQEDNVGNNFGHMLHLNWEASDAIQVRSISSYRKLDADQRDNGIGAHSGAFRPNANFARYSLASLRQKQWSQEFQILGKLPQLDFVAGAYYYHEEGDDDAWTPNTLQWNATGTVATRLPDLIAATPFPDRASTAKADSLAVFGQATWTPIDMLHLTVGARYTRDKKSGRLTKVNGALPLLSGVVGEIPFRNSSNRVDPMITLAFDPTDDIHLYGKWSTAYRAGGANSRSVSYRSFNPETVQTFEAGVKSEFFDNHVRFNLAAYSTRYENIQIDFSAVNLAASNRGTLETVNAAGRGTIKGIEVDASVVPFDGLTLSAGYAYTEGKLPPADNPFDTTTNLIPVFIVYTPDHAFTGSIDYIAKFDAATFKFHLDGNIANGYRSTSGDPTFTDKSRIFNSRVSLSDIDLTRGAKLQMSLWSRNLFNEQHTFYEGGVNPAFGAFGIFNEPRTYGIDATISF